MTAAAPRRPANRRTVLLAVVLAAAIATALLVPRLLTHNAGALPPAATDPVSSGSVNPATSAGRSPLDGPSPAVSLTPSPVATITDHAHKLMALKFSQDGGWLASSSAAGDDARLFNLVTQQTTVLHGHTDVVEAFAFSPNDQVVATADGMGPPRLWNTATGNPEHTFTTVTGPITVAFSPDGQVLAIGDDTGTVHLFTSDGGAELAAFTGHRSMVTALAFSPDGLTLASGGGKDRTVQLWDVPSRTALRTLTGLSDEITCLAFTSDSAWLLGADWGGVLHRWQAVSGLEGTHRTLGGVPRAISADARTLVVEGGADHQAHVWQLDTDTEVAALPGFQQGTAALSADGRTLALIGTAGGTEGPLQLWRLRP